MTEHDPSTIVVFTDGSCYPNPGGPGGWALYLSMGGKQATRYGFNPSATNNAMEMDAIRHALRFVPATKCLACPLMLYTDSRYCRDALNSWAAGWRADGWRTSNGKDVANREIIEETVNLLELHRQRRIVEIRWVRGHSGIPENELVDQLANKGRLTQTTNWRPQDHRTTI